MTQSLPTSLPAQRTGDLGPAGDDMAAPPWSRGRGARYMSAAPLYLAPSAWTEHVPFAFWLVHELRPRTIVELGTHYGVSYFAFCQAVAEGSLPTECFAVDTWTGDEHAGTYGEEVYRAVERHNSRHYSAFSTLVRSTFDDARENFEDGSIDLLHIDGLHTYEAVSHDFATWMDKMSPHGIVLIHDTNVTREGFGVRSFWHEVRRRYPHFEFRHHHGLGVLAVGSSYPPTIESLFQANDPQFVRSVFSRLGAAASMQHGSDRLEKEVERLNGVIVSDRERFGNDVAILQERLADAHHRTEEARAETARAAEAARNVGALEGEKRRLETELAKARDELTQANERAASKRDEASAAERERVGGLEAEKQRLATDLTEAIERLASANKLAEGAEAERDAAKGELSMARDELTEATERLARASERAEGAEAERERFETLEKDWQRLQSELREELHQTREELQEAREALHETEAERDEALARKLTDDRRVADEGRAALESERRALKEALDEAHDRARVLEREKVRLEEEVTELVTRLVTEGDAAAAERSSRETQLAEMTARLTAERETARVEGATQAARLEERVATLLHILAVLARADAVLSARARGRFAKEWLSTVRAEGLVDPARYLNANPDLPESTDAIEHYAVHGVREGRLPL